MQKDKKIEETVVTTDKIESYVDMSKLLKSMIGQEHYDAKEFLDHLGDDSFIEDIETNYRSYPLKVLYKQLPIVTKGDVLVKIVLLKQADSFALVTPIGISETYQDLIDDPTMINEKNVGLSLYAEIFGFEQDDSELLSLIKETYIAAGNSLKAFEITGELLKSTKDEKEEQEKEEDPMKDFKPTGGSDFKPEELDTGNTTDKSFDDVEGTEDDFDELAENKDALKKFKKQSTYLESLESKLRKSIKSGLEKHIKTKYLNENENILVIEINNKNIYKKYEHIPKVAKQTLTNLGESIRRNKNTQLIDSFTKDGKRYFVVAEHAGNNFWYVESEDIDTITEDTENTIRPIQDNIIKLKASRIRQEARKFIPQKDDKEILFKKR